LLSRYTAVEIRQIRLTKLHIFSYSSGANTTVEMPFAAHSTVPETSTRISQMAEAFRDGRSRFCYIYQVDGGIWSQ